MSNRDRLNSPIGVNQEAYTAAMRAEVMELIASKRFDDQSIGLRFLAHCVKENRPEAVGIIAQPRVIAKLKQGQDRGSVEDGSFKVRLAAKAVLEALTENQTVVRTYLGL